MWWPAVRSVGANRNNYSNSSVAAAYKMTTKIALAVVAVVIALAAASLISYLEKQKQK